MSTRTYDVDNKKMEFDVQSFKNIFNTFRHSKKITAGSVEELIAEKLQVATDTVHGWHYGKNAPSGIEYVMELAKAIELNDYSILLKESNGGQDMKQLTDRQLSAAKRIYDVCIWFLNEFSNTDGFNSYWYEFQEKGSKEPEDDIYSYVEGLMEKVNLVLDQEYFDLRNCDIYNDLCEFVSEDLVDTYNGKLSYAYRFEAIPDGHPTTSEDYGKAMAKLNAIIDKYLG